MINTTLFDLHKTAAAAAEAALGQNAFETETIKLQAFNDAKHDPLDYPCWAGFFSQHLDHYVNLKQNLSPATLAAQKAAAAAPKVVAPAATTLAAS